MATYLALGFQINVTGNTKFSRERRKRLDELGFVWDVWSRRDQRKRRAHWPADRADPVRTIEIPENDS
jgi:hypothetical protein